MPVSSTGVVVQAPVGVQRENVLNIRFSTIVELPDNVSRTIPYLLRVEKYSTETQVSLPIVFTIRISFYQF